MGSRQDAGGADDPGRLIALAAIGRRGQPGGIGLDQNGVEGQAGGHVAQGLGLGIGEIAGERDQKTEVERAAGLLPSAAEAVHDAAQAVGAPVDLEDFKEVVPGVGGLVCAPAMDEDGALAGGGNFELADQARALDRMGRAFVVVVEADFAAGDDLGLDQQAIEPGENRVIDFGAVVGIDAGAGVELGDAGSAFRLAVELAAEIEGAMHFRGSFADADGEDRTYAGLPGSSEHGGAVAGVTFAVKMGVRIDQQRGLGGGICPRSYNRLRDSQRRRMEHRQMQVLLEIIEIAVTMQ